MFVSQQSLAQQLGIPQQRISDIELGKRSLRATELFGIADALKLDVNVFRVD